MAHQSASSAAENPASSALLWLKGLEPNSSMVSMTPQDQTSTARGSYGLCCPAVACSRSSGDMYSYVLHPSHPNKQLMAMPHDGSSAQRHLSTMAEHGCCRGGVP